MPSGFFNCNPEEYRLAKMLEYACASPLFKPDTKDSGMLETYFGSSASYLHNGYTMAQLQAATELIASPLCHAQRRRFVGAFARLAGMARARLLQSMAEHDPAVVAPSDYMELYQLQATTQPGNSSTRRKAHSDGGWHVVAISYNVHGSAVCGYEHDKATQREMRLQAGQGWILCGPDVLTPKRRHFVGPSEAERVSLTFRHHLR